QDQASQGILSVAAAEAFEHAMIASVSIYPEGGPHAQSTSRVATSRCPVQRAAAYDHAVWLHPTWSGCAAEDGETSPIGVYLEYRAAIQRCAIERASAQRQRRLGPVSIRAAGEAVEHGESLAGRGCGQRQ